MWRIGIDVGGTFTDLFAVNEASGETRTAKVLTTKRRLVEGVMAALARPGIDPADYLSSAKILRHSCSARREAVVPTENSECAEKSIVLAWAAVVSPACWCSFLRSFLWPAAGVIFPSSAKQDEFVMWLL